jgi:hypothetical protein
MPFVLAVLAGIVATVVGGLILTNRDGSTVFWKCTLPRR